jgi:hypothetical protein
LTARPLNRESGGSIYDARITPDAGSPFSRVS